MQKFGKSTAVLIFHYDFLQNTFERRIHSITRTEEITFHSQPILKEEESLPLLLNRDSERFHYSIGIEKVNTEPPFSLGAA